MFAKHTGEGKRTMPRPAQQTIEAIIRDAADRVVAKVSAAIAQQVGALVQAGLERELPRGGARGAVRGLRPVRRRPPRVEITRWVADNRARRVPTFVIEATGLDTKKKIVARYGPNVAFEKGKPIPKPKAA
jgi:hypothetical protein